MTDDTVSCTDEGSSSLQVVSNPVQLFTGLPVGVTGTYVLCSGCDTTLTEGQSVTVYAYRIAGRSRWDLRRCYCTDCAPASVRGPTLGVTEVLVQAWLGTVSIPRTRTHRLCLGEVAVVADSPPDDGAWP